MLDLFAVKVAVIGTGYVGLVTAVCLSYLGHELRCLDINDERIEKLKNGKVPIYEPGLEDLLEECKKKESNGTGKYPIFTTSPEKAIPDAEVIFIAVGTPSNPDGSANLSYLQSAAETIGKYLSNGAVVINKSTVPVGSGNWVQMLVDRGLKSREESKELALSTVSKETGSQTSRSSPTGTSAGLDKNSGANPPSFTVASNPEFLREGSAIHDTLYPDRIVIGADDSETAETIKKLYKELKHQEFKDPTFCKRPEGFGEVPIISTDITSAEMIKYSANCFLAMKISFANQIANISDLVGANVNEVMKGIGTDTRIGNKFLNAGIGWGGSCFGKDVKALINIAGEYGYSPELLTSTISVNLGQRDLIVKRLQEQLKIIKGKKIGLLGLAFKPNTDDLRDAPALDIARSLIKLGANIRATDPIAIENCKAQLPDLEIEYCQDPERMSEGLNALVLVTEWDEYKNLDLKGLLKKMDGNLFIDGRNQYKPENLRALGFNYIGIGRS